MPAEQKQEEGSRKNTQVRQAERIFLCKIPCFMNRLEKKIIFSPFLKGKFFHMLKQMSCSRKTSI